MEQRWSRWLPAVLVAVGVGAAYLNAWHGPFVLDDGRWILENAHIRQLWPLTVPLSGTSRPVLQFSLAVNCALGGTDVEGYHLFNVTLHVAVALALYGLIWRTLARGAAGGVGAARWLAGGVALLWGVHPLLTQPVNYVVQRGELLMAACLMGMLYAFARATEDERGWRIGWGVMAVVFCAMGMGSKPVMVIAPLVMWWYDRAFVAGGFGAAWRQRRVFYGALAGTWLVLVLALVNGRHDWIGSAGVGVQGITPLTYGLTQTKVIWHYLRLAVWPVGLCFDPQWPVLKTWQEVAWPAVGIVGLLGASLWGSVRRPRLGFVVGQFWLLLAPTSSFLVVADLAFEHRMYLPLAVLVLLVVLGWRKLNFPQVVNVGVGLVVVVALGAGTVCRNRIYQDAVLLWEDTVRRAPHNFRAWNNLANALAAVERNAEAEEHYRRALKLNPLDWKAWFNLAGLLAEAGKLDEAVECYRRAELINPKDAATLLNVGVALAKLDKFAEALECFEKVVQLEPQSAQAYYNLGMTLTRMKRFADAVSRYRQALEMQPNSAAILYGLGNALAQSAQTNDARRYLAEAARLDPKSAPIRQAVEAFGP